MKIFITTCALFCLAAPAYAASEKPVEMGALQKQQMQTREYDASMDVVYPSVVTVVQDTGLTITTSDRTGGILTAVAPLKSKTYYNIWYGVGKKKRTQSTSFFIEPRPNNRTRVRLNITNGELKRQMSGFERSDSQDTVLDPAIYQAVFEKIDQAIFVRVAADGASASTGAAPHPTPSAEPTSPTSK